MDYLLSGIKVWCYSVILGNQVFSEFKLIALLDIVTVLLEYLDRIFHITMKMLPIITIMLTLCLMLSATYYAQNNAGIISRCLQIVNIHEAFN